MSLWLDKEFIKAFNILSDNARNNRFQPNGIKIFQSSLTGFIELTTSLGDQYPYVADDLLRDLEGLKLESTVGFSEWGHLSQVTNKTVDDLGETAKNKKYFDDVNKIIVEIEAVIREDAAIEIQRAVRGYALKRYQQQKEEAAAIEIQRVVRGSQGRKFYDNKIKRLNETSQQKLEGKIEEKRFIESEKPRLVIIDDAYKLEAGYYAKEKLHEYHFAQRDEAKYDADHEGNPTLDVKKIDGLGKFTEKNGETVFLDENGFRFFDFKDLGSENGFREFQNQISYEHKQNKAQQARLEEYEKLFDPPYDSISFARIKQNTTDFQENEHAKVANYRYCYVISSPESVEACYLSKESWEEIQAQHASRYKNLADFRKQLLALAGNGQDITGQYSELESEGKRKLNDNLARFFRTNGYEFSDVNSFANEIDQLVEGLLGNQKEDNIQNREGFRTLEELASLFEDFVSEDAELAETIGKAAESIEVDGFFDNRVKPALNNDFNNQLIRDSNKLRNEHRQVSLSETEKAAIKDLFPKDIITNVSQRESSNLDLLLNTDLPAALYDGIHVKRCEYNSYDLTKNFGRNTVKTEYAVVVFKGESSDNIMYLTLKGTDYHVKVRMDPVTKSVKIDTDNLYKKNKFGRWESTPTFTAHFTNPKEDIAGKLRNFAVLAISDVNGVRNAAICHNLKTQSFNLESTLSRDISGDMINDTISSKMTELHSINQRALEALEGERGSDLEPEADDNDRNTEHSDKETGVIRKNKQVAIGEIARRLASLTDYRRQVMKTILGEGKEDTLIKGNATTFSYSISKNIYQKERGKFKEIGYEITKVKFDENRRVGDKTTIETVAGGSENANHLDPETALTTALEHQAIKGLAGKEAKNTREIGGTQRCYVSSSDYAKIKECLSFLQSQKEVLGSDLYDEYKQYVMNELDQIASVKSQSLKDNPLEAIQKVFSGDDKPTAIDPSQIFEASANYNKIVAGSQERGFSQHIVDKSKVLIDRLTLSFFSGKDLTQQVKRDRGSEYSKHSTMKSLDLDEITRNLAGGVKGYDLKSRTEETDGRKPNFFSRFNRDPKIGVTQYSHDDSGDVGRGAGKNWKDIIPSGGNRGSRGGG
ncbi:MAG: hypothetical protein ISQ34_04875 [Rickettsiales bacterium]|nr:hypothetical protein [Rickettsiales bacterium]